MRVLFCIIPSKQAKNGAKTRYLDRKSNPILHTKIKSRHLLKTEDVDFSLCKKYVIMKQKRGNKRELYKTSKRVLRKAR